MRTCSCVSVLLAFLVTTQSVHADIVQVQVLHRHGARSPLAKHPFDPTKEDIDRPLLPDGVAQMEALGAYVRKTYVGNSGIPGLSSDTPGFGDILSYSSNLRRTLMSARAFTKGLYPDDVVITPVFASEDNDWIIRGYANCPKLTEHFEDFAESKEFKNKRGEDGNEEFVKKAAAQLSNDEDGSFENIFNIYDRHIIVFNDGFGREMRGNSTALSDKDMGRLTELADWYETTRFAFAAQKTNCAGGLLNEVMTRANVHASKKSVGPAGADGLPARDDSDPHRVIEYSVHYPTLLTFLAALRTTKGDRRDWPASKIPGFAAALFVELHKEDGDFIMRMKWYEGGETDEEDIKPEPMAIGREPCTNAENGCTLSQVERMVAQADLRSDAFCSSCESNVDVCTRSSSSQPLTSKKRITAGVIGGVVGLGIGLMLALMYMLFRSRRKRSHYVGTTTDAQWVNGEVGA